MNAGQKLTIHLELTKTVRIMGYPRSRDLDCLHYFPANATHGNALAAWAAAAMEVRECQLSSALPSEPLFYPMSTEVIFSSEDHTLSVPAALLIPPFFGPEGLPGINYGALGLAVSSALMGLLDLYILGEQSYSTTANGEGGFGPRLGCLKKAYEQEMGASFAMLNKMSALRDFVGLFPAYRAFVSTASAQRLQGLGWLNEEQLFFVSFCYQQCENTDAVRSPLVNRIASFRCNVPLRHMPQFADAFNCSSGSPMVSREPCYFWEASAPA
ncbi:kell blood group glycoprotein homolog [Amblyomma americanum]